jgi:phage terminase large subunit-like protein
MVGIDGSMKNYCRIARQYMESVLSGDQVACDWVKKACQRQKEDLAREPSREWKYQYKPKMANRVCQIIENFRHIEGEWAKRGQRLTLEKWQIFIYCTVFGWVWKDKRINEWVRRFRTVYIEMGRKNGKSTMSAPVGIYLVSADGEMGQEVYSAATTRDQAKEVWEPAWKMVKWDPELRNEFGIDTTAHSIYQTLTGSKFIPISAEGNSLDGLNGSSIIDELHAHRTRKVFDVLETAKGSRKQPLIWVVTTAGYDRSGICYEQRGYVTQILQGIVQDESYFGIIYTLDEGDKWQDESVWIKPNPNLGVSLDPEELRRLALKASKIPSAQTNFLTKHMSVWVNASVNLFNMDQWMACADPTLKMEDFRDCPCWIGLDFAPRNDFSSVAVLFRRLEDDGYHFYCFWTHFLSMGKIEDETNASYMGWEREGWIQSNPGNQTDPDMIEEYIVGLYESRYLIEEFDCDPSRVQGIEQHVEKRTDAVVVEVPQLPSRMCPATEKLDGLIADGKIHHNGDPVMAWMLSNVIGRKKGNWGLYPDKEKVENKIDGVSALLTALCRAMVTVDKAEPEYQVMFV